MLKLDVNVCIYFRKNVHLTGICKIPCESRIGFGDARFTRVSMVIATRGLAMVTLISGPGRDTMSCILLLTHSNSSISNP